MAALDAKAAAATRTPAVTDTKLDLIMSTSSQNAVALP
jgi:hypothetical protein